MSVGRICVRTVHVAEPGETVRAAARRMAERDVGTLVVAGPERVPLGIVTDRDLMRYAVAEARDADHTRVETVMAAPPVTVPEETPIEDALSAMARDGVRRLVVVDRRGRLAGLLALDDVLELLAEETATIGKLLARR
jgi:CBS domain-containing protein